MKRMKTIIIFIFLSYLSLCGCGLFKEEGTFLDRKDEISKVEIVEFGGYDFEKKEFNQKILAEISDVKTFIDELSECVKGTNWGDPYEIENGNIVIKITYENQEYVFVGDNAQWKVNADKTNHGYIIFYKDKFKALITQNM